MRALAEHELLTLCTGAARCHPVDRALALLGAALPELDGDDLAAMPIGERNALLLRQRAALFGDDVTCQAPCPACGVVLELAVSVPDLLQAAETARDDLGSLTAGDVELDVQALDSRALAAAAVAGSARAASRTLFERAVTSARRGDTAIAVSDLSDELAAVVAERVAAIDPLTEIVIELTCSACTGQMSVPLDPGELLWRELQARARRIIHDVHTLARAYGWSERDVLAVPPARRAAYRALVEA